MDKLDLQYTYMEGKMFYFMNTETFEEVSIEANLVGDKADFMLEGMNLNVSADTLFYIERDTMIYLREIGMKQCRYLWPSASVLMIII